MENRLKNPPLAPLPGEPTGLEPLHKAGNPGRLFKGRPIAVIDIGSNSVRLVVYEGASRSPTPIFNEKALCGLGRGVSSTGRLQEQAVTSALASLRRFAALCRQMDVGERIVLATAAARDAENGPDFLREAEAICGCPIRLLSGREEAEFAALGVISGMHQPDGLVGDLGGGSLELIEVTGQTLANGVTTALGGLVLQDASGGSLKKAEKIVKKALTGLDVLKAGRNRTFYAVGGTWRSLIHLHMASVGYPLNVLHAYTVPTEEMVQFCRKVVANDPSLAPFYETVSDQRRPLLAYGALVMEQVLGQARPRQVMASALGVREGMLFGRLAMDERLHDPLIEAAAELCVLRSRSPLHAEDLVRWTSALLQTAGLEEGLEDVRLRVASCLLADIGWRAHPDYRGEQSLNIIANAAFSGVDHPGRAFLAMTVYYRYTGLGEGGLSPRLRALLPQRLADRAKLIGAAMRVAYLISATMPGVLTRAMPQREGNVLVLPLEGDLADLAGDRISNRLRALARLIGCESEVRVTPRPAGT